MDKQLRKKTNKGAFISAAFLMGTTAIGPGFLVQNAQFTSDYHGSFGCIILMSVIISVIAQMNIWRVICTSGMRGQDLAGSVMPGLGYIISFMIIIGGLAFNIGNVGGGALGLNVLFGIPVQYGSLIMAAFTISIFFMKNVSRVIDIMVRILCSIMIAVIVIMIFITKPPVAIALRETFIPSEDLKSLIPATVTIIGATIGGYVTFSGAHRLIDSGVKGSAYIHEIERSSVTGIGITTFVRVLFFLAVLGVVSGGYVLDPSNPAADAFSEGAGRYGYIFSGIVMLCASVTPIISAAYTSVSFIKTFHPALRKHESLLTACFILISAVIMSVAGKPAKLLIFASTLNSFILPVALAVCLIASRRKDIMGKDYTHPKLLFASGAVVVVIMTYFSAESVIMLIR